MDNFPAFRFCTFKKKESHLEPYTNVDANFLRNSNIICRPMSSFCADYSARVPVCVRACVRVCVCVTDMQMEGDTNIWPSEKHTNDIFACSVAEHRTAGFRCVISRSKLATPEVCVWHTVGNQHLTHLDDHIMIRRNMII